MNTTEVLDKLIALHQEVKATIKNLQTVDKFYGKKIAKYTKEEGELPPHPCDSEEDYIMEQFKQDARDILEKFELDQLTKDEAVKELVRAFIRCFER